MTFGIKIWESGREIFNSDVTAAGQVAATWFGIANGGTQNFPEYAGRSMYVCMVQMVPDFYWGRISINVNYTNGWPQVTWGWVDAPLGLPDQLFCAFYAITR